MRSKWLITFITFFNLVLISNARADVEVTARALQISEAIETYREMQELFNEVCSTQDPATGAIQFAQDAVISNQVISADDGVMDCSSQLVALASTQEEIQAAILELNGGDRAALCQAIDDPMATARGDVETGVAAAEVVEFNTSCTLSEINGDTTCGNFFGCALANSVPAFMPMRAVLNCSSARSGQLVGGCATAAIEGAVNSVGGALSFLGSAATWVVDKGVRTTMSLSAEVAQARANLVGNGTQIDNNVEILTETDQAVIDGMAAYLAASDGEQAAMIRNGAAHLWTGINQAIISNFGCLNWDRSKSPAECTEVVRDFCAAPCAQKASMICGVLGFAAGELVSAALFGGVAEVAMVAMRATYRVGAAAVRGVGNAITEIPGVAPYLRRLGELRTLTARGLANGGQRAIRLVSAQFRFVRELPLSRAIARSAGSIGRGLQSAARNRFVTATWNGVMWVPHRSYGLVKRYLQLSDRMFQLGRSTTRNTFGRFNSMYDNMMSSRDGAVRTMSATPLELADELVSTHRVVFTRASVSVPGRDITTTAYRYQIVALEASAVPGTNLLDLARAPGVVTSAPGLSALAAEPAIIVTGGALRRSRSPAKGAAMVEMVPTTRPPPPARGLSSDELARRLGNTETDSAGVAISPARRAEARDLAAAGSGNLTTTADVNRAAEEMHQLWMRQNERLRARNPELFVPFDQLPAAARLEHIDRLGAVLRVGNPRVLESAAFRNLRNAVSGEARLADDAARAARAARAGEPPPPSRPRAELLARESSLTAADVQQLQRLQLDEFYTNTGRISDSRHVDEVRITADHLGEVLNSWPAAFKDEAFRLMNSLPLESRRKYLAVLLAGEGVPPIQAMARLRGFADGTLTQERYLAELDTQIADLNRRKEMAPAGADVSALANSLNRLNMERELIDRFYAFELLSLFSGRAHNDLVVSRGREPNMVRDSFGVDFRVRRTDVSFCRGSYATALTNSGIIGGFMTPCAASGFSGRGGFRDGVAGPTDANAHVLEQGYTELNRVAARDGEVYSLSMNGEVIYSEGNGAISGTGGIGTSVEYTTIRYGNPMTDANSRLIGAVDTLACPNRYLPPCSTIFSLQEAVTPARLNALDDEVARIAYLEGKMAEANRIVEGLSTQVSGYSNAILRGGESRNLVLLRQEYPDLSSALTVRREIEQRLGLARARQANPDSLVTRTDDVELRVTYDTDARAVGGSLDQWRLANPNATAAEIRAEFINRITGTTGYQNFAANQSAIQRASRSLGLMTSGDPRRLTTVLEINGLLTRQRHVYGGFANLRYQSGRMIKNFSPPLTRAEADQLRVLIDDTLPIDGVGYDPRAYPGTPPIVRDRSVLGAVP